MGRDIPPSGATQCLVEGHSWRRKWDYQIPPKLTDQKMCGRCHITGAVPWVPDLADQEEVAEWLAT